MRTNTKKSVVVVSTTPFRQDGSIDVQSYRLHLRRLAAAQCSVYVAGSGTSEAYTFTPAERDLVLAVAVEELSGKVQVRAMGCEPRTAEEMLNFIKAAENSGVDAAQVFSLEIGHGIRPSPGELREYYTSVLSSTEMPIYLSSHSASGYNLPVELVGSLVDQFPHIAGIAWRGSDIRDLAELIERVGDRIEVHCAGPEYALPVLGMGGSGFMGGEGNFSPEMVTSVISAWEANDQAAVASSFRRLMAFARIYAKYGGPSMRGLKPLMSAFGLPGGGFLRLPRLPLPDREIALMAAEASVLNLPGVPAEPLTARS